MALQALRLLALVPIIAHASHPKIAGYEPGSDVVSHNLLDLDQQAIEQFLKADDFPKAQAIYENGGNSGARAVLTVPELTVALTKGEVVSQDLGNGVLAKGVTYQDYGTGVTSVKVTYSSASAATCVDNVHAANYKTTTCFKTNADVTVAGKTIGKPTAVSNTYRTLQGFSTGVEAKFTAMHADRQVIFNKFKTYYTSGAYANDYVLEAFTGSNRWSGKDATARKEGVKKGIAFMNNWMYVVREFEDAIHDCKQKCALCNMDAVHAWDEGVAFYTGSLEGVDTHGKQGGSCTASSSTGCMIHALADKRCTNYGTCDGNDNAGPSIVNQKLFAEFAKGRDKLQALECDAAVANLNNVIPQMTVPLVQGALRYAYKVGKNAATLPNGGSKEKAEGAVFAAAVLPLIHSCNAAHATLISDNMKIDSTSPMAAGFAKVKEAFESNYACLGITCADVGGLLQTATTYYEDFAPCGQAPVSGFASSLRSIALLFVCAAYVSLW